MAGKPKEWPRIYPKPNPGGSISWQVDLRAVGGKRPIFPTKAAAEARAQAAKSEREREGKEAGKLSFEDRVIALHCINRLKPFGVQLDTAVGDYMKYILPSRQSKTVKEIIDGLVSSAARKEQHKWKKDLEDFSRRFCPRFGDRKLAELQKEELQNWLDELAKVHELGSRSLKNYRYLVSYLFRHGRGDKERLENLALRLDVPPPSGELPGFYTIEETRSLLIHAAEYDLIPYIAIRAFAGIRRCEIVRLDWSSVREKVLDLTAKITKRTKKTGRARRLVEISDMLAVWLAPFRNRTGPVIGKGCLDYRMEKVKAAAGITRRANNFLRHGFATYHLAAYDNDDETSRALGHVDTEMLHGTYKGREVEEDEGKKYFALTPEAVFPGGVIPTATGKYIPVTRSQQWITPEGQNPFRSGSLLSVLFARGSKDFISAAELIQTVAAELNHPLSRVRDALFLASNPRHGTNKGRCVAERNAGKIRLVALPVGIGSQLAAKSVINVVAPIREKTLASVPFIGSAVVAGQERTS